MLKKFKKAITALLVGCMIITCIPNLAVAAEGKGLGEPTPFAKYGAIKVAKDEETGRNQLCDEDGNPIQLRGMSTFGLQWGDGSWVLNDEAFNALAYDWKCDIIRLAMYVEEEGYAYAPEEILARVEQGIELATERGMYVLVDWHMLSPGDPTKDVYLNAGKDLEAFADIKAAHPEYTGPQLFFAYLSEKYGDNPQVLFETANEPNGLGSEDDAAKVWEEKLLPYHKGVVEAIREYDADDVDNIVILGTDNWSQFVDAPAASYETNNVEQDVIDAGEIPQIMYTVHFYAGTHDVKTEEDGTYWLGQKVLNALEAGVPVFCTEWGTSEATGDGGPYINYSERWLNFFEENKISWCAWSLAKKNEISAAMKADTPVQPEENEDGINAWTKDELSISGNYVRAKIRGDEELPMYGAKEIVASMEDGSPLAILEAGSPIANYEFEAAKEVSEDNHMLFLPAYEARGDEGGLNSWGGPRISFQDLGTQYSIYKDLIFDVYVENIEDIEENGGIAITPVIQTEGTGWWGQQPDVSLNAADFAEDEVTGMWKAPVKVTMTGIPGGDKLGHVTFQFCSTVGFYVDDLGFETNYNGDISEAPVIPDTPGAFIELPFDFEDGQREGWKPDGDSKIDYLQITIDEITENDHAMSFPITLEVGKNEWEDGARMTSPFGAYGSFDDCTKYDAFACNIYVEKDKATTGTISVEVCSIPNGEGYWYQSGTFTFDPAKGEEVTTPGGRKLLKYYAYVPVNADPAQYGTYPFQESAIRNTILALHGNDCDYSGRIYYDNIRYIDVENFDDIDKEINQAAHQAILDEIKDNADVAKVKELIAAIGTVGLDNASKAKIDAARAAYNALSEAAKKKVAADTLKVLTDAEAAYQKAVADKEAADKEAASKEEEKVTYTVKFSAKSTKIKKGKSSSALASDLKLTDGDKVKSWKSSNSKVVKVTSKGKITAKKKGTATITVTTVNGATAKIKVTVTTSTVKTTKIAVYNKATDKKVSGKTVTLKKGAKLQLRTVLTPITSPDKVSYKTSNKKVVTVTSKGKITAKKKGTATVTVKSGKKSVKVKVKVK